MIIALLSDIHANLEALNACLKHAAESGSSRYAFLGDFVGYGADPQVVVDIVARYAADGAIVIKGNHDEAVEKTPSYMNDSLREVIQWSRGSFSGEARAFLCGLVLQAREGGISFVHASAATPRRWGYIDSPAQAQRCIEAANTTYTFAGHVH